MSEQPERLTYRAHPCFLDSHGAVPDPRRHRSEQYRTCSQSRAHLRRQVNGKPQRTQIFCGSSDFFFMRGMVRPRSAASVPTAQASATISHAGAQL